MAPAVTDAGSSIWLNEWASRDLDAKIGDAVELEYYLWDDSAGLVTRTARFTLAGVVGMGGRCERVAGARCAWSDRREESP